MRAVHGPVVVAGDFNAGPWSHGFQDFMAKTGLTRHATLAPTWPAWPIALPQVALDHILVSGDLAVVRGGTGPAVGSDHLPVVAEVAMRKPSKLRSPQPDQPRDKISDAADARPSNPAAPAHFSTQFLTDFAREHDTTRDLRRR